MRSACSLLMALSIGAVAFAQSIDNAPPAPQPTYQIELVVLEGKGVETLTLPSRSTNANALARDAESRRIFPSPDYAPRDLDGGAAGKESARTEDSKLDGLAALRRLAGAGRNVLAAPKLAVRPGQPAKIQIQSEQTFTYLVPLGDNKFESKRTGPHKLGIDLDLQVDEIEGQSDYVELSSLQIEVAGLDGREPVEGLDLAVGRPIISTRSLKTSTKMRINEVRLVPIPSGPETEVVLAILIHRISASRFGP